MLIDSLQSPKGRDSAITQCKVVIAFIKLLENGAPKLLSVLKCNIFCISEDSNFYGMLALIRNKQRQIRILVVVDISQSQCNKLLL